jgi:hypothetical protein
MNSANPFSKSLVTFTPDTFFGRRAEIEIILQGVCGVVPRSFVLHGNRTTGKTTLLSYLCQPEGLRRDNPNLWAENIPEKFGRLEFIYIDFYNITEDQALLFLWSNLVKNKSIIEALDSPSTPDKNISKRDAKASIQRICQDLNEHGFRLVICIDHFDKAYRSLDLDDEGFLRSLTKFTAFIYSTDKSLPGLRSRAQATSPLYNILIPREIGLLSETEASHVILKPTQALQPAFNDDDAKFLSSLSGRHPYILTLACEYLFNIYQEYPDLQSLISQQPKTRQQIELEILSLPSIQEIFSYFWGDLALDYQSILIDIAQGKQLKDNQRSGINTLRKNGLVTINLSSQGQPAIFSPLFQMYILDQKTAGRKKIPAADLGLPNLDQKLLNFLRERPGQVCTFDELLSTVWGDPSMSKRRLDASIHRIRSKLKDVYQDDWEYIENVRGQGFKYVPAP